MKTNCVIGVDLGGQSVKLAIVDSQGSIRLRRQSPIDANADVGSVVPQILSEINALLADGRADDLEPRAIGMVMPGYMDPDRTQLVLAANLPKLSGNNFLADLKAASPLPIEFDADCNAAAMAEYRFGAGKGVDRLIVVAVGTGVGGGVIINGKILRIRQHIAGSLGHVIVDATGPKCKCGARGCVEFHASGPVLDRLASHLADANPDSVLAKLRSDRGRLTGVEIAAAIGQNDPFAAEAVAECGWWLGAGAASWSVIYSPQLILVAGGIACLGEPLLAAVRRGFEETAQPALVPKVRIGLAGLQADAGAIGAAALVTEG